jgi:hypothetical protein
MLAPTGVQDTAREKRSPVERATRRRLYLYLLPLVASPALLLAAAVFVIPSQWFALRSGNTYLVNLAYGAKLQNADCQILVYGDSSAMVAVDPALIREHTGLSTCNIAEFQPMTLLNGMMVLDTYLKRNARPRFLIFLFTPEDLALPSQRYNGPFEAITYRMRQPHRLQSLIALAPEYSNALFSWAEQGMRFVFENLLSKPASLEVQHLRDSSHGQLRMAAATRTSCETLRHDAVPDKKWIADLRSKYGRDGMTTLVDATPVATCDPSLSFFEQHSPEVIDNRLETLPIDAYTIDGRLHVNAKGSKLISEMLADQIVQQLQGTAPAPTGAQ